MAAAEAITRAEAMADLRLEVKDPEGPVPVGADAIYELHVRNRGTKAAENVEVMAYFSNGVEPVSAEGQTHRISPGQVVFDRIPAIPPAGEMVLTVKAKAGVAGNHVFRAELHCRTIGTRLVREEVTHFYQDGPSLQQATATPAKPAPTAAAPVTRDETRTAERQAPLPLPQSSGQPAADAGLPAVDGPASALNVIAHELVLGHQVVVLGLEKVADRDHAHQTLAAHDRHVANAVRGHHAHQVGDRIGGSGGDELGGHDVGDRQLREIALAGGKAAEHVALGDDAHQPLAEGQIALADEHRADVVLDHLPHDFGQNDVGRGREDGRPFHCQDVLKSHGIRPPRLKIR